MSRGISDCKALLNSCELVSQWVKASSKIELWYAEGWSYCSPHSEYLHWSTLIASDLSRLPWPEWYTVINSKFLFCLGIKACSLRRRVELLIATAWLGGRAYKQLFLPPRGNYPWYSPCILFCTPSETLCPFHSVPLTLKRSFWRTSADAPSQAGLSVPPCAALPEVCMAQLQIVQMALWFVLALLLATAMCTRTLVKPGPHLYKVKTTTDRHRWLCIFLFRYWIWSN